MENIYVYDICIEHLCIYPVLIGMRCKGCEVRRAGHRGNGEGEVALFEQNVNVS